MYCFNGVGFIGVKGINRSNAGSIPYEGRNLLFCRVSGCKKGLLNSDFGASPHSNMRVPCYDYSILGPQTLF